MVEKGPRGTLDVFDVPLAIRAPELAMLAADNFRFETYRGRGRCICWWVRVTVTL